jgi:nitrite reductase/ring-hydroxylating ferredoxin subunit
VKQGDRIHALRETCTHLGGPLAEGTVEGDVIHCPWHGSRFSLEDGSVVGGPATFAEVVYEVRVRNGQVEVRPGNQD